MGSKLINELYEERFRRFKPTFNAEKFNAWMRRFGLTNYQAGIVLGYAVRAGKYDCDTVYSIRNGTWSGWSKPMEIVALQAKMKKAEEFIK